MALVILISSLILSLDQITKYLAERYLASLGTLSVIQGIFHLTLVHNNGAAFGIFKGGALFFIILSLISIAVIFILMIRKDIFLKVFAVEPGNRFVRICLGLILGGAFGNLIDRLRNVYVIDFLDFRIWPVFNIADSAITIGGIMLCVAMLKKEKSRL